jgi:predicted nucleic acid-binding protein
MHKLFIDINVILDVAMTRDPHADFSKEVLSYIERKKAVGYISAISCATIYYLVQKDTNHKVAIKFVRDMTELLTVVDVTGKTLERGFELGLKDLEDGIQIACAEACKADYIITRDAAHYKNAPISWISPAEYLATFVNDGN